MTHRSKTAEYSAAIIFFVAGSAVSGGADTWWPGWLGPERNGWVEDFDAPVKWPDKLEKRWQATVGTGYGTPVVIGDRIFQHARQGEDEVVWCLDLKSGDVIWRQATSVPFKVRGGGEFHGKGPKSCPVYADGRLFTLSITGDLTAWDADSGEQLWKSEFGRRYQQNHPHWGAAASPIADGSRVVMHFGNDNSGELVALNAENGKVVWSLGGEGASYSSPLLVRIHGVRQVVEWNHESLVGVDAESGKRLWSYPFPHVSHNQNMPTPAVHEGRILLGAENRGLHSIEPKFADGQWTAVKNWSQEKIALDMSSAVINNGRLYGMSHYGKGRLFCVDPRSGDILWQSEGRFGQNATFLSIPGQLISLNDRGKLRVVKTDSDRYTELVSWQVSQEPTWAPPVLLADGFLIKDRETLVYWSFADDVPRDEQ